MLHGTFQLQKACNMQEVEESVYIYLNLQTSYSEQFLNVWSCVKFLH